MKRLLTLFICSLLWYGATAQADLKTAFDKGIKLMEDEKYDKAAETFTGILQQTTERRLLKFGYVYRAYAYQGSGRYDKAIADLERAMKIDTADLSLYLDRAEVKADDENQSGARNDYLYVLSKDSTSEKAQRALLHLAEIAYGEEQYAQAIAYYDKLIALKSNDAEVFFNRGMAKTILKDYVGAIADYDKAIALNPDYREAYANRGFAKVSLLTTTHRPDDIPKADALDACADLQKAKSMGDTSVSDIIKTYCHRK